MATLSLKNKSVDVIPVKSPKDERLDQVKLFVKELQGDYELFKKRLPMKVGINIDLLLTGKYEGRERLLGEALRFMSLNPRYLKGIVATDIRYDLELRECGAVLPDHKSYASEKLAYRKASFKAIKKPK